MREKNPNPERHIRLFGVLLFTFMYIGREEAREEGFRQHGWHLCTDAGLPSLVEFSPDFEFAIRF